MDGRSQTRLSIQDRAEAADDHDERIAIDLDGCDLMANAEAGE